MAGGIHRAASQTPLDLFRLVVAGIVGITTSTDDHRRAFDEAIVMLVRQRYQSGIGSAQSSRLKPGHCLFPPASNALHRILQQKSPPQLPSRGQSGAVKVAEHKTSRHAAIDVWP
jgi:hypothetical protein